MSQLLTVNEAASRLAASPITIRKWIAAGRLDSVKLGRGVRILETEVERVILDNMRRVR